jgi:hypothetical protein
MRWTSIAEISANLDPSYRVQKQKQQMQLYIAQGKMEQDERHHSEMMHLHHQKMESERERSTIEAHASIEKEIIAGKNAIALADRNHVLGQLAGGSAIIDDMIRSQLKQEEDWNATYADTMRQLFVTEGDTIRGSHRIRNIKYVKSHKRLFLRIYKYPPEAGIQRYSVAIEMPNSLAIS